MREYDRIAAWYTRTRSDVGLASVAAFADRLASGARVLDLGCGDGLPLTLPPEPTAADLEAAFVNFAVYDVHVSRVDFLQLGQQGQRRCRWGASWRAEELTWVTP